MSLEDAVKALDAAKAGCPSDCPHEPWLIAAVILMGIALCIVLYFSPNQRRGE